MGNNLIALARSARSFQRVFKKDLMACSGIGFLFSVLPLLWPFRRLVSLSQAGIGPSFSYRRGWCFYTRKIFWERRFPKCPAISTTNPHN
jgi:hypothetical protein